MVHIVASHIPNCWALRALGLWWSCQQQQQLTMNTYRYTYTQPRFIRFRKTHTLCMPAYKGKTKFATYVALYALSHWMQYIYRYITYTEPVSDIELWIRLVLMLAAFQANADEHITRAKWEKNEAMRAAAILLWVFLFPCYYISRINVFTVACLACMYNLYQCSWSPFAFYSFRNILTE